MKRFVSLLIILLSVLYSSYTIGDVPKTTNNYQLMVNESNTSTDILFTVNEFNVIEDEEFTRIDVPHLGKTTFIGLPELPVFSKLVAIPNNYDPELEIISLEKEHYSNIRIAPVQPDVTERQSDSKTMDQEFYQSKRNYPNHIATISDPMIFRDFRVVRLSIYPFQYNPGKNELTQLKNINIRLNYTKPASKNIKYSTPSMITRSFDKIYQHAILNYDQIRGERVIDDGSMLIITHDQFEDALESLAEWKNRKGIKTELVPLSEIGENPTAIQIKGYIYNYYMDSDPKLEYVVLVGDVGMPNEEMFPCFFTLNSNETDHPFSELEGSDYLPEVHMGRLSVDYVNEAVVIANKIINYESNPSTEDSDWFKEALMVGARYMYQGIPVTSPRETKRWVHQELVDYGYSHVDTIYYPEIVDGAAPITDIINSGVSIVNYRGWAGPTRWYYPNFNVPNVQALDNGGMLPFVTSIVCGTGKFNSSSDPCFGEAWLRTGSPNEPAGGIGFYGSSETITHTIWNNTLDAGIYIAMLHQGMNSLGGIVDAAEIDLISFFPGKSANDCNGEDCVKFYFNVYNLLGDPSLNLWTDVPSAISVTHESEIPIGQNYFDVSVTSDGSPVEDALVCIMKGENGEEIYSKGRTDINGNITLPIEGEFTSGNMYLTVTKSNIDPYLTDITITDELYVGYESHTLQDDNGEMNPGDEVGLLVTLKNFGAETAEDVSAEMTIDDPYVDVTHSEIHYGNIPANATVTPDQSYELSIDPGIPHNYPIRLHVNAFNDNQSLGSSIIDFYSHAVQLQYNEHQISDDGIWDSGETVNLSVELENIGGIDGENITGNLITYFDGVTIDDSNGEFGNIAPGNSAINSDDVFTITADSDVYEGINVQFLLELTDANGYDETLIFHVPIGEESTTNPLGPDTYGYYGFDHTDTDYEEAPEYNWIEIDPDYGGNGTALNLTDDGAAVVDLPFTFNFYGESYEQITINANGWISMGHADWHYFLMENAYNYYIGCEMNPKGLIAPYWDNLNFPEEDGDIFTYYDSENHKFIVQWSHLGKKVDLVEPEYYVTFETVLFDPEYHDTITNDGEILIQYHTIPEADECTIGIEKYDHSDGLQYLYNTFYSPSATEIGNNTALKFTTDTMFPTAVDENNVQTVPEKTALKPNYPNPFNPVTRISYSLSTTEQVNVSIYDMNGRLVKNIVSEKQKAGIYNVTWNGTNEVGNTVESGMYFYTLSAGDHTETRRCILLK